jgi:hypothetical protein
MYIIDLDALELVASLYFPHFLQPSWYIVRIFETATEAI